MMEFDTGIERNIEFPSFNSSDNQNVVSSFVEDSQFEGLLDWNQNIQETSSCNIKEEYSATCQRELNCFPVPSYEVQKVCEQQRSEFSQPLPITTQGLSNDAFDQIFRAALSRLELSTKLRAISRMRVHRYCSYSYSSL